MPPNWTHLIRFVAKEDGQIHLGQIDPTSQPDVGLATYEKKELKAQLIEGSIYDGVVTEKFMTVSQVSACVSVFGKLVCETDARFKQLLSPISTSEVPIIRCLGLNYRDHAKEARMPIPDHPVLFVKPRTALNGPYPQKIIIPKVSQDGSADYEAELTFIISKTGKDIPKENALDYVLGYTCGNDVSARTEQFRNSQWSFSKGRRPC